MLSLNNDVHNHFNSFLAMDENDLSFLFSYLQVTDLIGDIRRSLADCIFCISAQSGLNCTDSVLLINSLSQCGDKSLVQDGTLDDVSLTLVMALLYAVDVRILDQDESENREG